MPDNSHSPELVKHGETSDGPPTLKRSGYERQEERLHPLPFWKGRGLGSGLRPPSSQEGDRGVEKPFINGKEGVPYKGNRRGGHKDY